MPQSSDDAANQCIFVPIEKVTVMQFTYYGQSCFSVKMAGKSVLFDPFITPNELAKHIRLEEIQANYVRQGDFMAEMIY